MISRRLLFHYILQRSKIMKTKVAGNAAAMLYAITMIPEGASPAAVNMSEMQPSRWK